MSNKSRKLFDKRKNRNRFRIKSKSKHNIRLSVFRSNSNIYAQIIDDNKSITLLSVSTLDKKLKQNLSGNGGNIKSASIVGTTIAKLAIEKKIKNVYFDRGGYLYHGRIKALAEAAREEGLNF